METRRLRRMRIEKRRTRMRTSRGRRKRIISQKNLPKKLTTSRSMMNRPTRRTNPQSLNSPLPKRTKPQTLEPASLQLINFSPSSSANLPQQRVYPLPSLANQGHDPAHPSRIVVGLVGYPNVGKSSTINSLLGEKRVSVSSTPGKTKHFQTIHLPSSDDDGGVILCDCPGLVFPNFASTKAELVCNGVLPIDQLREWTGPAGLLAQRIPREVFEQVYSFKVYSKSDDPETGRSGVTGEELLISFACILRNRSN